MRSSPNGRSAAAQPSAAAAGDGPRPLPIAFFDLDRTLLDVNSAKLWIARQVREGRMTRMGALRGALWLGAYRLGFAALEDAILRSIATLAGKREAELRARTRRFFDDELASRWRPGAARALERERRRGAALWLLTSSTCYLSEPVVEALGLEGFLANRFEVEDGVFTGAAHLPLCYGPGKVAHAAELAAARGVALADCSFYTDSYSDRSMLEAVGRPVAVHPDPRLRRLARRRGWPIEDWSCC